MCGQFRLQAGTKHSLTVDENGMLNLNSIDQRTLVAEEVEHAGQLKALKTTRYTKKVIGTPQAIFGAVYYGAPLQYGDVTTISTPQQTSIWRRDYIPRSRRIHSEYGTIFAVVEPEKDGRERKMNWFLHKEVKSPSDKRNIKSSFQHTIDLSNEAALVQSIITQTFKEDRSLEYVIDRVLKDDNISEKTVPSLR